MKQLKVGIVGYGGLGHVHTSSLLKFNDVKITCVCDIDSTKFEQEKVEINFEMKTDKLDISTVNTYADFDEMLEKENIDILVSALPSDIHADYAIKALNKGVNVFSEKPMSLTVEDCNRMIEARNKSGKELMIAQCVRFTAELEFLETLIENKRYGKLWSMFFSRAGAYPGRWFMEGKRSGGAILDLHVHDIDWINYKFGMHPDFMSSTGIVGVTGEIDEIDSIMKYGDILISVRGSWMSHAPFTSYYIANFENATFEFNESWDHIKIYDKDHTIKETIKIDKPDCYAAEMRYFIDTVKGLHKNDKCTAESCRDTIAFALKERDLCKN